MPGAVKTCPDLQMNELVADSYRGVEIEMELQRRSEREQSRMGKRRKPWGKGQTVCIEVEGGKVKRKAKGTEQRYAKCRMQQR